VTRVVLDFMIPERRERRRIDLLATTPFRV
jgi:hypothetical protein